MVTTKTKLPRVKCMYNLHPDVAQAIRNGAKRRGISLSAYVAFLVQGAKS